MPKPRPWQIWAGQYIGVSLLITISIVAALGFTIIPDDWVGLLGLVPLALGGRGLIGALRSRHRNAPSSTSVAAGLGAIAGITVANGVDNVSVYTPVFRTIAPGDAFTTVVVFLVLIAVWCLLGALLGSHKTVIAVIERYGHWIVPFVFVLIGSAIVGESGVLGRLL